MEHKSWRLFIWKYIGNVNDSLLLIVRLGIGVLLVLSSLPKFQYPHIFLASIYDYELVGRYVGLAVAIVLPMLEFIIGMCLITGTYLKGSSIFCTIMFFIFLSAVVSAEWRGLQIGCGCYETGPASDIISPFTVVRNVVLFALSLILTIHLLKCPPNLDKPVPYRNR